MRQLPPLDTVDYVGIGLIVTACVWVLSEHWMSRKTATTPGRKMLRAGSSAVVFCVAVLYVGRLIQITPWYGRTLLLLALIVMGIGYRQDRRDASS